jgi:ribonuclease HI
MSIAALAEQCRRELNSYRPGEACDERHCLELLRRATVQGDQLAWECLQELFSNLVRNWLHRHPGREAAYRLDSEENYIAQAFERFWQATSQNQQLEFRTTAAALQYLRVSLHGTVVDTLRAYAHRNEVALPEPDSCAEPLAHDDTDSDDLWEALEKMLHDVRERRVAYLLFHCGLKPREIVHFCHQEFSDVNEIYRLRRNIFERLRRNADQVRQVLASLS